MNYMETEKVYNMLDDVLYEFERDSFVYGTANDTSDKDIVFVVPDSFSEFLDNYPNSIYEYNSPTSPQTEEIYSKYQIARPDFQFLTESTYINLIRKFDIMAMESLFIPSDFVYYGSSDNYIQYFNKDDKWGIRQSISATASNSWAKAHKKMTVEKDLDIYKGQKSLFHSLRILMFGNQLCEFGKIKDYSCANDFWNDIYYKMKDASWEDYKAKYKPVYNSLRSKLAELAPKPIENEIKSNKFPDTPINAPFIEYVKRKIADSMFIPKDRLNNKKE